MKDSNQLQPRRRWRRRLTSVLLALVVLGPVIWQRVKQIEPTAWQTLRQQWLSRWRRLK